MNVSQEYRARYIIPDKIRGDDFSISDRQKVIVAEKQEMLFKTICQIIEKHGDAFVVSVNFSQGYDSTYGPQLDTIELSVVVTT